MSEETQVNIHKNNSSTKEIKPRLDLVSYKDLILFKEEMLKEIRSIKTKISENINNEFGKYSDLFEKVNLKLSYYDKDKSSYMSKIGFVEEKEKLLFEIKNINDQLKNEVTLNKVHITDCRKDLDNSCFKYDNIVFNNLIIPGLIGNSCKFQNLKEYILYNKDELNNALHGNKKNLIEINTVKKKVDSTIKELDTKIKSLEFRLSNFVSTKYHELDEKFNNLYEELNKKMITLNHEINSNLEERKNELARLKNFVFEENNKAIDKIKITKNEIINEFEFMKINFKKIKKNIVSLTNLLMGRSHNLNKQFVMSNFNNMMIELFKEFNVDQKISEYKNDSITNNKINKKGAKKSVESYLKKYIEGKISFEDTKFHSENTGIIRKKSVQLNEIMLNTSNKDVNLNNFNSSKNNENGKLNKRYKPRLSQKMPDSPNFFEKKPRSYSENQNDDNKDINKENNQFKIETMNENIMKEKNSSNYSKKNKRINNEEIIDEEDSNKYLSSNSKGSLNETNKKSEKRKDSHLYNTEKKKKLSLNIKKRISFYDDKKGSYNITNTDFRKNPDEFSENSSSSIIMENSLEIPNKNVLNKKYGENISNNMNNSPNKIKKEINKNYSKDLKITNDYIDYKENINNTKFKDIEKDIYNNKKDEDNKVINNKILFKELKTENPINFNIIKNKININSSINSKKNCLHNIKKESNEKFLALNKIDKEVFHIKKNKEILKKLKDNVGNIEKNIYHKSNTVKTLYDGFQLNEQRTLNPSPRIKSPIIINTKKIKDNNDINTKGSNSLAKTFLSLNKKIMDKTRNKKINTTEENKNYATFDKLKTYLNKNVNTIDNQEKLNSDRGKNKIRFRLNNINSYKDDKDIYISKDIAKNTRYIKDEDIIDKPLLYDMNIFKIDKKKGSLENRINELEYFTKKKLDELVKEIKIFIPIHFNSYIRNYTIDKN